MAEGYLGLIGLILSGDDGNIDFLKHIRCRIAQLGPQLAPMFAGKTRMIALIFTSLGEAKRGQLVFEALVVNLLFGENADPIGIVLVIGEVDGFIAHKISRNGLYGFTRLSITYWRY